MPLFPSHKMESPLSQRTGPSNHVQTPPPPAGSAASTLLKRYRPLETRATGGFGSVEICLDSRLQRRVAIKRMPLASPYNRTSTETTATALAEARTASMLQHPNIVQVIDFSYDSAYAYLVMEYVDGMSLEEFLEQVDGHSLTYDEAVCIADALVQALTFAHENGVLHLDIKPANVLIDRSGHVKLADFGMATLASAAGFGGARGGTIGYMASEQLEGLEVDERSDIFSLASVLYESLCATAPFRAGTPIDSLKRIEAGVLYPSDLLPDIPESAEQALLLALAPNPAERMTTVATFGDYFCHKLGNPSEGRKSLARLIARLTSDDAEAEQTGSMQNNQQRVWELDPAKGSLGSRSPKWHWAIQGILSGLSVAVVSYALLGTMGQTNTLAQLANCAGIGLAAGIAPQIGSALAFAGWLMLIFTSTPLLQVLPIAILGLALGAAWWLVWGRTQPATSATLTIAAAVALLCHNATLGASIAAGLAAYFLPALPAAMSTATGLIFAQLLLVSLQAGGALTSSAAAVSLFDPGFLLSCAGFAACSALASAILNRTWQNYQNGRGTSMSTLAYILLPAASLALRFSAHPMEITSVPSLEIAQATGIGALSSILVWLCVYSLGYKRDEPEGDRS